MTNADRQSQYRLSGAWNFRDVGGARTEDGRLVRNGVLFRSSELSHLDDAGRSELTSLGVRQVFDLRGDAEVRRSGVDAVPGGVTVVAVPYRGEQGDKAPHEELLSDGGDAQLGYMLRTYTSFPSLSGAHKAIRSVVHAIGAGEGPALVHCAAGKDRAGWTIATVLRAVGVTDEHIVADFMASNDAIEPLREHVKAVWPPDVNGRPVDPSDALLGVAETYYRTGLDAVTSTHGSFEGYLDAIGVTQEDLVRLRGELLVDWS
ncbi:tyrosine-protein phosphatase [Rhodococcus sp. G-MC3]|uniref:tyrosine-protein phosphatase n=1 Tax=Rhodococcus sp. G-MC3 TaxID=3046209 RepID=UPI0024BB7F8E|nr:tyrosine-protein phosphatase [Rhodococcus sp. G-MC3]MDJ0392845.1 tyrosine-protein phosphatase [Rhodococcus sp. G-MC3]